MTSLRFLLLALVTSWAQAMDNSVCRVPPIRGKEPDRPILPVEFEAHIVLNIISQNFTTELHQFYSFPQDHSVIEQREYGVRYYSYADYQTKEFIGIYPDQHTCSVTNLATNDNRFLFGYKKSQGKAHTSTANDILHFFERDMDSVERYVGTGTARGIPCRVWYSCTYWKNMESTMNIYWYFSDPSKWSPSYANGSIPVRAWVIGRRYDAPTKPRDFEHKYEFLHWKTKISRPYYFQTPRGVSCPGRVNTKSLPSIPNQFSFTLEQVDKDLGLVTFVREWYDKDSKLFRYEYRPGGSKAVLFGDTVLSEVHDFNTGIAYVLDSLRGNCSIMPIDKSGLDDVNSGTKSVRLRSAVEFFYLDGVNPTYEGVKQVRGLDTDTWVAIRPGMTVGFNVTWEWAFLSNTWGSEERDESTDSGGIPVQLTQTNGPSVTYYNVYHFQKKKPLYSTFDISGCYVNRNRRVFQFSVPASNQLVIRQNLEAFERGVVNSIVLQTGISPLRIANVKVVFETTLTVSFEILDVAPIDGDVKLARTQVDLKTAGDLLLQAIRTNAFTIPLADTGDSTGVQTIHALPSSVKETAYTVVHTNKIVQSHSGYTAGTAAGLGVAMAVVGVAMGGGAAVGVNKRLMSPTM